MGVEENLATHLRWAEAGDRGDLSQHHEFVHEDIVVDHLDGETIIGRGALIANMQASLDAMPDYSNVIGFTDFEHKGIQGVEGSLDEYLHGQDGFRYIEHNRAGQEIVPRVDLHVDVRVE